MSKRICVIGAGSWGSALAILLSKKGHQISIWDLNEEVIFDLEKFKENKRYLPGVLVPENVDFTTCIDERKALSGVDIVLLAVPTQVFRPALIAAKHILDELGISPVIVNVAKGIEQKSLKRISEIAEEVAPTLKYCILSGPSHAEEVGGNMPTTVVISSSDLSVAQEVQDVFMTERFRVYTNSDVIGVELGGSLKNIIALGAGISDGMGFGDNTKAALMTRGMTEMVRLGTALGASADTFYGLTGIGDLIVTCTSEHSRNRRCGIMIGQGIEPQVATEKVGMIVEGMFTAEAAHDLARRVNVEMPITEAIYKVINGQVGPDGALKVLMTRDRKSE